MSAVKHGGTACEKGGRGVLLAALAVACSFVLALAFVANAWADEAAPVADDDVFVALYSRDGGGYTLVFQKGEGARAEYGPLEEVYPLDEVIHGGDNLLEGEKAYVLSAVVADVLQPESTAQWFRDLQNLKQVDIAKLDTSKVTNMWGMFSGCSSLKSLDLSKFDTSKVTDMNAMFSGCSSLKSLDLSKFDTSKVKDMDSMFWGCSSLGAIDLSKFDTSQVVDASLMFGGCSSLKSLAFPASFKAGMVENMWGMFLDCSSLKTLDLSGFDTSKVTDMSAMFSGCSSLEIVVFPAALETKLVTNMEGMFSGCSSLKSLDLSKFDTSKVTDMGSMFSGCSSLKDIQFPATFTTDWVTDMSHMFEGCTSLKSLDLSKFDTSKVTDMGGMFNGSSSLEAVVFPAALETKLVTTMNSMFYDCSSLKSLDLSKFNTARVTDMTYMFSGCSSLKSLDLSKFDMESVGYSFYSMLSGCNSLDKITLPSTGDFTITGLPSDRGGEPLRWRNEKGEVFKADAIPARTAGTYTAVVVGSDSDSDSNGDGTGSGNGNGGDGDNSGSNDGNGGSNNGSGSTSPTPKRTVVFSEAVALPLDATGVAMDKDDIVRDLAKRFGSREGFPAGASSVTVTIKHGGEEVDAIDPTRAGTYGVTAVYSMPDGTERVIEAAYTVADPAAKAPVKSAARSATRLAQTGDEVTPAVPLATAALAACALAAAVAVRHRARG